jgi:hypothetical protein
MMSPFSTRPMVPPSAASGRDVADRQARGAAGEAAVGDQGAGLAQSLRFQVAGRIEHLLHAGSAARAFVADQHHVAGLHDLAGQDAETASSWLSKTTAGPENFRIESSTPAVFTMQPSRRDCQTARQGRHPAKRHARRLRITPPRGRCRAPCSGGTGEKASVVRTPPGAAGRAGAPPDVGDGDVPFGERLGHVSFQWMVPTDVSSRPAAVELTEDAMMPPARWTSSMWTSLLAGATLHSTGTLRG